MSQDVRTPMLQGIALACILALCSCRSTPPPAGPRPEGKGTILVTVQGLPSDQGQVLINLFLDPKGFPNDHKSAWRARKLAIKDGKARTRFKDVPAGPFAISAFHDADMDKELDTNILFMPTEHWGVSRDAGGFLGPPAWRDAVLQLKPDQTLDVPIQVG